MSTTLDEDKFKADHADHSDLEIETPGEGGKVKERRADKQSGLKTEAKDDEADKADKDDEDKNDKEDEDDKNDDDDKDDEALDEAFDAIFGDADLSEDAKAKMSLIFKAAIAEGVSKKTAKLEETIRESLRGEVEDRIEALVAENEQYMDYVAETFMKDNKIAIESSLKVEIAESLIASLQTTLAEHNITVDTSDIDLVEDLEKQIETMNNEKNMVEARNMRLSDEVKELKAEKAFNEISEGLTDVEKDRLHTLSEALSIKNVEAYKEGLSTIRESFFKEDRALPKVDVLDESSQFVDNKAEEVKEDTFSSKLFKIINS